jgi:hypothetical protein
MSSGDYLVCPLCDLQDQVEFFYTEQRDPQTGRRFVICGNCVRRLSIWLMQRDFKGLPDSAQSLEFSQPMGLVDLSGPKLVIDPNEPGYVPGDYQLLYQSLQEAIADRQRWKLKATRYERAAAAILESIETDQEEHVATCVPPAAPSEPSPTAPARRRGRPRKGVTDG